MDRLSALPFELLDMVCQSVQLYGHEHIASLRSCNHCLKEAASQYLFAVLVIGPRKRLLRRIKWVAARPHFAKGVTEIEYDVTRYNCYTWGSPNKREWLRSGKIDKSWMPSLHYMWNLHHEQARIIGKSEDLAALVSALPSFHHVSKATISNRDMKRQSQIPRPCLEWVEYTTRSDYEYFGYECLFQAFAGSSHRLREFSVFPRNFKDGEMVSGLVPLKPHLPGLLDLIQAAFEHLTVVSLRTSMICHFDEIRRSELHKVLEFGVIAEFLGCASRLRRLSLSFDEYRQREVPFVGIIGKRTWDFLEQVELDGIDVRHTTELCDFLNRHSGTINTVTLRNINLMDGQWMMVADCLRGLPALRGLLLDGLEVKPCKYLDCFIVMETIDCAMGGRHNNLIPDMDTLLGGFDLDIRFS